jgi:dephospho-CoA kinase
MIIGLTGNIATGKSAVMRLAAERGALTIDADKVVHELLEGDDAIQAAVADAFGPSVRRPDGRIDRAALGAIVFSDPAALARLEALLHPATRLAIAQRVQETTADVVMIEAIKLLDGPLAEVCDQVWVTTCPEAVQLERLRVCRGMAEDAALTRIRAQSPQSEKVGRADVVIDTGGLMTETQAQVERAWADVEAWAGADEK